MINNLNKIEKPIKSIEWNTASAEKDGYDDFMLKEIYEQPNSIRETIGSKLSENKIAFNDFEVSKDFLENINRNLHSCMRYSNECWSCY